MGKLLSKIFGNKEMRILMLGLDAAGKTSILLYLSNNSSNYLRKDLCITISHAMIIVLNCYSLIVDCMFTFVLDFFFSVSRKNVILLFHISDDSITKIMNRFAAIEIKWGSAIYMYRGRIFSLSLYLDWSSDLK